MFLVYLLVFFHAQKYFTKIGAVFMGSSALSSKTSGISKHKVEGKAAIDIIVIIVTEIVTAYYTHFMPKHVFTNFTYVNTPKHPKTLLRRHNITYGTDEDAES